MIAITSPEIYTFRVELAWSTVKWAFSSYDASNWHPLTWLSHALDYQMFGLNPAGHHVVNVLIHGLNAVLLFLLLTWGTKRVGASLLVAGLFAVHPLNVESVAWVAERKNVLSTLFFLLTIGAYGWYARKPEWRRYLLVAALFAAGLLAKPMVITLPFVLLLLDYWPLERMQVGSRDVRGVGFARLVLEKIPLLLISGASAWVTLKAQQTAVRTFGEYPLAVRIENAVVAYGLYLEKMFWPARLATLYPHPTELLPMWQVILSGLTLIAITALVVKFRRKRYLPVGWFWFLGSLVPVIGLVQVGIASMADRYAYTPLIGIFVMIAWGADDLAEKENVPTMWRIVPAACVLLALGAVTHRQMSYWESEYALWSHTLAVTERNPIAQGAMASALINPDQAMTANETENFGAEQRIDEARRHHQEALKIYRGLAAQNPDVYAIDVAMALQDLGNLDRYQNRTADARQHYDEALATYHRLGAKDLDAHLSTLAMLLNEFGALDGSQNRKDDQRRHYEEAVKVQHQLAERNPSQYLPDLAMTLNNLGRLDAAQNRIDDALQHYGEGLKFYRQLAQGDPARYQRYVAGTLDYLGFLNRSQNRVEESRADFQESLALFQKLLEVDRQYARDVARVENSLRELDRGQAGSAK